MKLKSTTKVSPFRTRKLRILFGVISVAVFTIGLVSYSNFNNNTITGATPCTSTSQCSAKIRAAQADKDRFEKEAQSLRSQADSLGKELAVINLEKEAIQAQVNLNQAKNNELTIQIANIEKQIQLNRDALGDTIADIQVGEQVTPLEMIFGSKNISEYLDVQESRHAVREDLSKKITEIKNLKAQAEKDKAEVDAILKDQKAQNAIMAAKQAQQNDLLAETQGSEAKYSAMVQNLDKAIAENQRTIDAIAAASRQSGGTGGAVSTTAYPYGSGGSNPCPGYDPWGYCKRQCVSYVAWHLAADNASGAGNSGYTGLGHAFMWWNRGRSVATSDIRRGDVIVQLGGPYGHVMYVEGVSGGRVQYTDFNGIGGRLLPGQGSYPLSAINNGTRKAIRFN